MAEFYCHNSIVHETTIPYTPEQNGIAERAIAIFFEMVWSMLYTAGICKGISLELCLVTWVGSYLRADILPITFLLSPSFPFCVITCDAFSSNNGLCVIICQVPWEQCLDDLVV